MATRNFTCWGNRHRGIQRYGKKGAIAGAISIPLRHIHQTIELAHKKDILNTITLLKAGLTHLDQYDWSFSNTRHSAVLPKDEFDDLF